MIKWRSYLSPPPKMVVDAAFKIHSRYGPGLLESAYQAMLERELEKRGLDVLCEQPIRLVYDGEDLGIGYRAGHSRRFGLCRRRDAS